MGGGLASHGATITLILTLIYYARTENMTIRETFDRFAIGVSWAASIIRLGNLMNSEIVGRKTDSIFGFKFPLMNDLYGTAVEIVQVVLLKPV